jgi:hypothetical protein
LVSVCVCKGGPVKSSSGVSAKTVLHLSDMKEQDDWMSVTLIPSYVPGKFFFFLLLFSFFIFP